jgi:NAD+ synthase
MMRDFGQLADKIAAWLRDYAAEAGLPGYVVGLSGGIDSAVTAALCQRAVGDEVLAVLMPCYSSQEDIEMARLVAGVFGLETEFVDLSATYDTLVAALPPGMADIAKANIKPRLRMAALYTLAQTRGYLVAGTGNKSEMMVGYFTKYGDGGVDVEPLGGLLKSEVRHLARVLGVPEVIVERPPTAGLWPGQTDEDELGMTYHDLDSTLVAIEAGRTDAVDPDLLQRVQHIIAATAHKRSMPPVYHPVLDDENEDAPATAKPRALDRDGADTRRLDQFRDRRARMNERILSAGHLGIKRFFSLDTKAYQDGALPTTTKELLGLVASAVLRCDDCIDYHLIQCVDAGFSNEELYEALNVALVVGGSIVIPHLRHAFETIDLLRAESGAA